MKTDYFPVANSEDIPVGSCKSFDLGGDSSRLRVIVAHLADGFHAVENRCSHLDSLLDTSRIYKGRQIACPTHCARFDLKTGAAKSAPAFRSLAVFPVRVRDGRIEVALTKRA